MSNYGWTNEAGEPIMDGAAYRFEQQLDLDSQADYMEDHFYDNEPAEDYDECKSCGGDVDPKDNTCWDCGLRQTDESVYDEPDPMEDQWLDSYMEDRMTTMFE